MTSTKRNGIHEFSLHDLFQFCFKFQKAGHIYHPHLLLQFFLWYALIEKTKCKNRNNCTSTKEMHIHASLCMQLHVLLYNVSNTHIWFSVILDSLRFFKIFKFERNILHYSFLTWLSIIICTCCTQIFRVHKQTS